MHGMFVQGGGLNDIRLGNQEKSACELEVKRLPVYCTGFPNCFCIKILLHVSFFFSFFNSLVGKIYVAVGASLCMKNFEFAYLYVC